jgi:hypothetical protein
VKHLTTAIVVTLCLALPAQADVYDPFIVQLRDQGYSDITVGRTWLGRIVINAQRDDVAREIVLNARTGEILGDQAGLITETAAPQYSTIDDDDDDGDQPRVATAIADPVADPLAATVADIGDAKAMLDTGTNPAVGD